MDDDDLSIKIHNLQKRVKRKLEKVGSSSLVNRDENHYHLTLISLFYALSRKCFQHNERLLDMIINMNIFTFTFVRNFVLSKFLKRSESFSIIILSRCEVDFNEHDERKHDKFKFKAKANSKMD